MPPDTALVPCELPHYLRTLGGNMDDDLIIAVEVDGPEGPTTFYCNGHQDGNVIRVKLARRRIEAASELTTTVLDRIARRLGLL